jgi:dynein heavy chain, axonemal
MPPNPVLDQLKSKVFEFRDTIPVVTALRNPCLTDFHWSQLKKDIIGKEFDIMDVTFTLKSLVDLNV